jgi:hypothetical protein
MLARQFAQAHVFNQQFTIPVGNVGLAGEDGRDHGVVGAVAGLGVDGVEGVLGLGTVGVASKGLAGTNVCGSVARWAAAGSVGRYRAPG